MMRMRYDDDCDCDISEDDDDADVMMSCDVVMMIRSGTFFEDKRTARMSMLLFEIK